MLCLVEFLRIVDEKSSTKCSFLKVLITFTAFRLSFPGFGNVQQKIFYSEGNAEGAILH